MSFTSSTHWFCRCFSSSSTRTHRFPASVRNPVVLGLRLVGDGGDRFDRHAQQCGYLLRAFAHGLQLVDLHRISLLLWLAELYRLGGLLRLLLRRRVPWVDRSRRISLIRGLHGLLGRVLLLRVCRLGLLHAGLLGLAAVHETVDAGSGFDVEFEHLRRLGRVAPLAETHEPFRDGVARLRSSRPPDGRPRETP